MFSTRQLMGMVISLGLLTACGGGEGASNLDGHFENSTAKELAKYNGLQRATAEHEASQGVIVSLPLFNEYQREDLGAAILKSGVDNLWVVVPNNFNGSINSGAFSKLRQLAGTNISKVKIIRQQKSGNLTVWARDWSPLSGLTKEGKVRLLDFNYYPDRRADDFTAQSFERVLDFDRISIPVYNEGGNFMASIAGHCLMTTRVTDANAVRERSDDYILSASGIKSLYGRSAGCKKTTIFPRMPYEGTGHIDMWAKFLDDKTVIVSELRNELVNLYNGEERALSLEIQTYLNERAKEIKALGYNVIRIPTPSPIWGPDAFRSYTNSLIVNKSVIVPRYITPDGSDLANGNGRYIDAAFLAKYEAEVRSIYEKAGYSFTWIPSDGLIADGGAVHCSTMQIARGN